MKTTMDNLPTAKLFNHAPNDAYREGFDRIFRKQKSSVGQTKVGNNRFYLRDSKISAHKRYLDRVYQGFNYHVTPKITLDDAAAAVEHAMRREGFDTSAELCVDVDGIEYRYTDSWEPYDKN